MIFMIAHACAGLRQIIRASWSRGLAAVVVLWTSAAAAVPFSQDVFCGTTQCGTMTINQYQTLTSNLEFESKYWLGGVAISGSFSETQHGKYHYIQSITSNSDTFRWINDTATPLGSTWLDTPPGGYKLRDGAGGATFTDNPWDTKPWYDEENEFPGFADAPRDYMLQAKTLAGHDLEFLFETWLVCLIAADVTDNGQAKDDSYEVATLLGWQWGYDITYLDIGTIGQDDPEDFTVTAKAFSFILNPTADWRLAASSATRYGQDPNQDYFNIDLGDCVNCVPEPVGAGFLLLGLVAMSGRRRRGLSH